MFNKRYEVHRKWSVHKGFEKEAEFDTREDAQRCIDDEVERMESQGWAWGDVNESFKIVECNTPTATQSDKQSEKGVNMINLLNGSVTDRINYAKSLSVEKIVSELEATKPLLVQHEWCHDIFSHEIIDGEVKTTITAWGDSKEDLKSLGMTIRVNGNKVFSVSNDGAWHEGRYNSDGSKSYDEFGTGNTSEFWAKYTRWGDSELYVMTNSRGEVVTEVEADIVGMAISPD